MKIIRIEKKKRLTFLESNLVSIQNAEKMKRKDENEKNVIYFMLHILSQFTLLSLTPIPV